LPEFIAKVHCQSASQECIAADLDLWFEELNWGVSIPPMPATNRTRERIEPLVLRFALLSAREGPGRSRKQAGSDRHPLRRLRSPQRVAGHGPD
jgi:hypothetical protein